MCASSTTTARNRGWELDLDWTRTGGPTPRGKKRTHREPKLGLASLHQLKWSVHCLVDSTECRADDVNRPRDKAPCCLLADLPTLRARAHDPVRAAVVWLSLPKHFAEGTPWYPGACKGVPRFTSRPPSIARCELFVRPPNLTNADSSAPAPDDHELKSITAFTGRIEHPTAPHGHAPDIADNMLHIVSASSPVPSEIFALLALLSISVIVLFILRHYLPLRTTPAFYLVPIFFALWLPACMVLLVPIDLASSARTDDEATRGVWLPQRMLLVSWRITYWLTFALTWYGILPLCCVCAMY